MKKKYQKATLYICDIKTEDILSISPNVSTNGEIGVSWDSLGWEVD